MFYNMLFLRGKARKALWEVYGRHFSEILLKLLIFSLLLKRF
jgi:hypothetical protein